LNDRSQFELKDVFEVLTVYHDSEIDYLSIDFTDEVESKSVYDKRGHVICVDITDSMKLFAKIRMKI